MTTFAPRPALQDIVKSAMAATSERANIGIEAARQMGLPHEDETKTASAEEEAHSFPTEMCEKYASALDYLAEEELKEAADPGSAENASPGVGPGQGANALEVSESNRTDANIDAGQSGQAKDQIPTNPPMSSTKEQSSDPANAMATNDDDNKPEQPTDPIGNATASNAAQKTAEVAQRNLEVLSKLAKSDYYEKGKGDATDKKGRKWDAKRVDKAEETGGKVVGGITGAAYGGMGGAAAGGALANSRKVRKGVAKGALKAGIKGKNLGKLMKGLRGKGTLAGAAAGAVGLGLAGAKGIGSLSRKGSERQRGFYDQVAEHSKKASVEDLAAANLAVLSKMAEDAINPAQISAGAASAKGADAPDGVSAAEEGPEPPKPGPANSAAALVGSNDAAINYDKRQAKTNSRADMANLLREPMHSKSGDQVLSRTLEHTAESGAKIAASRLCKTAAAKALLLKLAKEQADDKSKAKKEKQSQAGGDLSTPSGQSGFTASSPM